MKKNILFIAKNIPTPLRGNNKVILTIAQKLNKFYNIDLIFPAEFVPFFITNPKFNYVRNIFPWESNGLNIIPQKYIKLPFGSLEYWFSKFFTWNNNSKKIILKTDIVHAHYLFPDGIMALKIFRRYKIPYFITIRSHDIIRIQKISKYNPDFLLAKKILGNARKIFVFNIGHKRIIESLFNFVSVIIPHGIESDLLIDENRINEISKNENLIKIVLIKKEIDRETNLNWLYYLCNNLDYNVDITIIGNVPKNQQKRDKRIKYLGIVKRNEILKILEKSDLFILPRSIETFGLVYLEAAAKGNVIIGHSERGVEGIFTNFDDSFFVSSKYELLEIVKMLVENEDKITYFKKKALMKVRKLDWKTIIEEYKDFYENVKIG